MRATLCGALMVLAASTASAQQVQSQERAVKPETAKPPSSSRSQLTRTAAAPSGGLSLSDWRSQASGILERSKRYPPSARSKGEQGTAVLAFTLNRQGKVTSAHIARSSGSAALDEQTLALVHGVSFPPPPAEMIGRPLLIPVKYTLTDNPCGRFGIYWAVLCRLTQPPSAPTSFRPSDAVSRTYASSSEDVATIRQLVTDGLLYSAPATAGR
jgi:TonB family protein